MKKIDSENSMWISVSNEYEYMLNDKSYDWCLLLPTYMAIYYKTELYTWESF